MMINALNSGARVFMADLEDALSPTWANVVGGQAAIADATRGTLTFDSPEGKAYRLGRQASARRSSSGRAAGTSSSRTCSSTARRSRPRCSTSGMYLFHSGAAAIEAGSGPYLYLAKLESHHEARLWNEVFIHAQAALGIPRGIDPGDRPDRDDPRRVRDGRDPVRAARARRRAQRRSLGLPVQRHQEVPDRPGLASPDRAQLTMTVPFMRAYTELLVRTCHRRGAHAIGGMAAFIPNRRDPEVTDGALARVRDDKERESGDGFDGTWVAHPDLVPVAMEVFDGVLGDAAEPEGPAARGGGGRWPTQLLDLAVAGGAVTEAGVRANVRVALAYLDSWLRGVGRRGHRQPDGGRGDGRDQPLAALAVDHPGGRPRRWRGRSTPERYATIRDEELARLGGAGEGRLAEAADLLDRLVLDDDFAEFLTLRAYAILE